MTAAAVIDFNPTTKEDVARPVDRACHDLIFPSGGSA